jgi:hypothetical protein
MEFTRREDRMAISESRRSWSAAEARVAEECEACKNLLIALIHQTVMDTTLDPTQDNSTEIRSAFKFLFRHQSRYFDVLGMDQTLFCKQLLRRMRDLNTPDEQLTPARKKRFWTNFEAQHLDSAPWGNPTISNAPKSGTARSPFRKSVKIYFAERFAA